MAKPKVEMPEIPWYDGEEIIQQLRKAVVNLLLATSSPSLNNVSYEDPRVTPFTMALRNTLYMRVPASLKCAGKCPV